MSDSKHDTPCGDVTRHRELHQALDELLACWFSEHVSVRRAMDGAPLKLTGNTTIAELMEWSARRARLGQYGG